MIDLSKGECEEIVRKATNHKNVKIINFHIESFGSYVGFLGEYFRLKIDTNVDESHQEINFFVKSLPLKNVKLRKLLIDTRIFKKEVFLYENLLSTLSQFSDVSWCPNAFLFRDDLLVLNDMTLEGYKMLPFDFKFTQAHVESTLKCLASFHCCSIVYEHTEGKSITKQFESMLFETSVADISWYHAGLKTIYDIALLETSYGNTHRDMILNDFYEKIFGSISNMESAPYDILKVASHRDIWKNNLMFNFDDNDLQKPKHCVLVDFQTTRYLPISIDVLMAIICTTRRRHHDEYFKYYIEFYFRQLEANLEKFDINLSDKMSFESFRKTCHHHKFFALVYNTVILMITMIPREYFIDLNDDENRDFFEGNRSKFVLNFMKKDEYYKENLIEAVESVVEFILSHPDEM
ncbi:CLUMA_CG004258, isoform A [Clunio marinus]|uniref:CLUMA_CG004258, isoform A n=1 Tax=Clunio marinus TaxID=568069 RepID=A0A1J1HSN4_9DIPT|nr:CLUMA_CG004258, isoform A [Clunio marinus]